MNRKSSYPGSAQVEGVKKDIDRNWEAQRQKDTYKKFDRANYERYAADHVMGRNSCVVRGMCFFNLMRAAGLTRGTDLTLTAAHVQHFAGDAANKTNAAHCIPGQVLVGASSPWDIKWFMDRPLAAYQLRTAFGQTSYLPRSFNVADTAHERVAGGSGEALLRACMAVAKVEPFPRSQGVFKLPQTGDLIVVKDACRIDRPMVRNTFDQWLGWVDTAYELARNAVKENKYVEKGIDQSELLEILRLYKKFSPDPKPSDLLDRQMDEIERVFNVNAKLHD